jgi:Ca-activated chloride channel homolog
MTRRARGSVALLALAILAAACTGGGGSSSSVDAAHTLTILAGSELKDLEPLLPQMDQATGMTVKLEYAGTLAGTEELLNGSSGADLAWFSSNRYLTLAASGSSPVRDQRSIMLSPVVIGVKDSLATQWGWKANPNVTWADVAAKAADGELRYAMTNPAASNSGFSALVGVASALAGTGSALQSSDIDVRALKRFFSGQAVTAGSSGFLADAYVRDQSTLGGIINYESVLRELNASGHLSEPLTLIYPRDGIVTADYPLMLLNDQKRAAYDALVDLLLRPETQRWIMANTDRRPVSPDVALDPSFPRRILVELPFPASLDVVNHLLDGYLNEIRPPSHTFFVLDTSGSMAGDRLASLQQALRGLTGLDNSLTGAFSGFRRREVVTMIAFDGSVDLPSEFQVDTTDPSGASMQAIRSYVDGLQADGNTAIYSALDETYRLAADAARQDPDSFISVVLMTDGENNYGMPAEGFQQGFEQMGDAVAHIPTYAVLFGESSPEELEQIATLTGGKVFDARTSPLDQVFKEIRGYQ